MKKCIKDNKRMKDNKKYQIMLVKNYKDKNNMKQKMSNYQIIKNKKKKKKMKEI